jgi:glycosyltransferase involved in cell wall biosynthesis
VKLAGTTFIRNGETYDYCYMETIACLLEFCDHVFVVDAGSDDGTCEKIEAINSPNLTLIKRSKEEWDLQKGKGKTKLCYFTDMALYAAHEAGYDYSFYLQCDEILHERSYNSVREAIKSNIAGYLCKRINLWDSPYTQLKVPQNRMPCSPEVVRLTQAEYRSYGDAESIAVPILDKNWVEQICIYHMGFVRKREVMKDKVINMQENVFELGHHDPKLDLDTIFQPKFWFIEDELELIEEPLPQIIKKWAIERVY